MRRRPKLDAGNFPTWEERIDYQLRYAFDHCYRLRTTDLDLFAKVGTLEGRADKAASAVEVQMLRSRLRSVVVALVIMAVLLVALTVAVVALVVAS